MYSAIIYGYNCTSLIWQKEATTICDDFIHAPVSLFEKQFTLSICMCCDPYPLEIQGLGAGGRSLKEGREGDSGTIQNTFCQRRGGLSHRIIMFAFTNSNHFSVKNRLNNYF